MNTDGAIVAVVDVIHITHAAVATVSQAPSYCWLLQFSIVAVK